MKTSCFQIVVIVSAALSLGVAGAQALPDANTPIDPTKRATVSTSDAVRPSAGPMRGDGVIPSRMVPTQSVTVQRATINGSGVPIDMTASSKPVIIRPEGKEKRVRSGDRTQTASSLPAAIPRLDRDQYRKMISAYARGATPASEMTRSEIVVGDQRVNLGEINRYASPRSALEQQAIPVAPAGNSGSAPPSATPVPFRQP